MNLQRLQAITGLMAIALLIVVFEVVPMPAWLLEFKWLAAIAAGVLLLTTTGIELTQREARAEFAASVEEAAGMRPTKWRFLKRIEVVFGVFLAVFPFVLIANSLGISLESTASKLGMSPFLLAIFAIVVTGGSIWGAARGLGWKPSRSRSDVVDQPQGN